MALDNAQFIAELSITDPPGTDPLSQGDDQIRTTKRATFQSFPFIAAQVSLTDVQLNDAAIKAEANVFTANQTIKERLFLQRNADTGFTQISYRDAAAVSIWDVYLAPLANNNDYNIDRNVGGILQDTPFRIRNADGVVEFTQPPEIGGAAIWIAGEIRQFAIAAVPGNNWFFADGTNGTANLADRWLAGAGAFAGAVGTNLNAALDAQTVAGNTGATALSVGQLPAHGHALRGGSATGVTDGNVSTVSSETVVGGQRGNLAGNYTLNNSSGNALVQQSGSGNTHSHTVGVLDVVANNPTFTGSVQPVSITVERYQYVP